jgi:uncharacterized protein YndB with AHSA1/START domain
MTDAAIATRSIIIERTMPHPPEKVWRALTQAPLIEDWLMQNDFQPVVGHRFTLRTTPQPNWNGVVDCEVLEVEPHTRLAYRWNASGAEAEKGLKSTVTWTLTRTDDGTHLRMEHAGFRPQDESNFRGASYGWKAFMARLEDVVAAIG